VTKIPHAKNVARALRSLRAAVQKAEKSLNKIASRRMIKGDYSGVEALAEKGKEIRQFRSELEALRKRWRELQVGSVSTTKVSVTPLWMYYQPVLQALSRTGGECRRDDLEDRVQHIMASTMLPGDRMKMARGRERWRRMVQKARKPLATEGWIEDRNGPVWRITDTGRRAAEKPISKDPASYE
jgi:hypothetical protein